MRRLVTLTLALVASASAALAQAQAPSEPVTVESYYRIKWGAADEFKRLYKLNHQPILKEMQRQGFITDMKMDEPFTHMAGGPRWDLRVTITYRDPLSAVVAGGAFDKASDVAKTRLYRDQAKLKADEAMRFGLLEDHWDVIVTRVEP
ncbi:MAG: hypothetical protein ABIP07_02825 [Sphingomicrobium sp.]